MRMLVTGAGGFLGSHLVDWLLNEGHEVVGVDSFVTGEPRNVEHLALEPRFTLLQHDVIKPLQLCGPIHRIYHLASPASPIDYLLRPIETLLVNSAGTHGLLEVARAFGSRFLLTSTSEVYGDPDPFHHPQREDYFGNVNPIGPRSCYDESKRFAEALVMSYHRNLRLETRIVRIFNTYGPRMRQKDGRVVPMFLSQALRGEPLTVSGNGCQTRSFCYISDMIEGIVRVMESGVAEPVNLGNPDEVTIRQLAQEILELTGSQAGITSQSIGEDDPQIRCPDITRAQTLIGWQPVVARVDGLRRTMESMRA